LNDRVYVQMYLHMQSTGEVLIDREKNLVTLRARKYKLIKGFTEFEWIDKKFIMKDYNGLLRLLLKNIFRYQRIWT
jgi:hypothetical protein